MENSCPDILLFPGLKHVCDAVFWSVREENSLVEQFVFEVLVVFVESLALAHADEKSMGKAVFLTCSPSFY